MNAISPLSSVSSYLTQNKKPDKLFYLAAAGWGGRSASQTAAHWSSGWPSHSAPSTCWLSPKCWSSSLSSRHCHRRGKRQRGGRGTRGPWGSRWPRCRRREPRKWHRSCLKEPSKEGCTSKIQTASRMRWKLTAGWSRQIKVCPPIHSENYWIVQDPLKSKYGQRTKTTKYLMPSII